MFICRDLKYHTPLGKHFTCFILPALALVLHSCSAPATDPAPEKGAHITVIADTNNAQATYQTARQLTGAQIDSLYFPLTAALNDQNRMPLLLQHLNYLGQLRGKEKAAQALIARCKGHAYNYEARYDSAKVFFDQAITLYTELGYEPGLGDAYLGLATNHTYLGDFDQSLAYRYKALAVYEKLHDLNGINRTKTEMAIDFYYQKDYPKAVDTARATLAYYTKVGDSANMAYSQSMLSTFCYNLHQYAQAETYALASLAIRRNAGAPREIAESLNNLSLAYMAQNKKAEAVAVLQESLQLMQEAGDIRQIPIVKQNLAACLNEMGRQTEGEALIREVIADAIKAGQKDAVANAYKKLYVLYKDNQQFEKALEYYRHYKAWRDSLYNEEKARAINELNIAYQTQQHQAQIAQLKTEKQLDATRKSLYLAVALLIAMGATLTVIYLAGRNRKHKQLIEKVRQQLDQNKAALQAFTENIIAKNKFIEELETKLQEAQTATPLEAPAAMHTQISDLYQFKILTEADWMNFKILFDKVHPGFINRLRQQFPDLAPGDQRQALLIKLNIDNKECAGMLGISADSVKKNRYRLKKKFNLTEQENLDDFVRDFA